MKIQKDKIYECRNCKTNLTFSRNSKNLYCSNRCQVDFQFSINYKKFIEGENNVFKTSVSLRKAITKRSGYKCFECGISNWMNKPLMLEVDHINGCNNINTSENLRLLCSNCHSQTPTFKARNKGNGRESRRLKLRLKNNSR